METSSGLVAGSHNRKEFVRIRHEGEGAHKSVKNMNGQVCQICGDTVGVTDKGEIFIACNECAFPVCRPCYEYERKDGTQACPQCKSRYKRLKGSPRVDGDDEEDDADDLDNEFDYAHDNGKAARWESRGKTEDVDLSSSRHESRHTIPRLTSGLPALALFPTFGLQSIPVKERITFDGALLEDGILALLCFHRAGYLSEQPV